MTDRNALQRAHQDVQEAESKLRELERAREAAEAGGFADADGYSARKDELESELAKAKDELHIQEQRGATERAEDLPDMTVDEEGVVEPEAPVGVEDAPHASQGAAPPAAQAAVRPEAPSRSGAQSQGSDVLDRDAAMRKANAEIDARVKAKEPVKPWNPVIIARPARRVTKQARQLAAAAAIGTVLVGLGVCGANALTARPQAVAPAVEQVAPAGLATARPAQTSRPGPVAVQELLVTPTLLLYSGGCPGRVPLPPQTIQNPLPGQTGRYVWEPYMIPKGCGGGISVELDYMGVTTKEAAVWRLFQPQTEARRAAAKQLPTGAPGDSRFGTLATYPPEWIVEGSGVTCTGIGTEDLQCQFRLVLVVTNRTQ